jgi:hypothetical protein
MLRVIKVSFIANEMMDSSGLVIRKTKIWVEAWSFLHEQLTSGEVNWRLR